MNVTRRQALSTLAIGALAPVVLRGRFRVFAQSTATYSTRTIDLVRRTAVVDLLNQFQFADYRVSPVKIDQWLANPHSFTAEDAARYRDSGITVFCLGDGEESYDEALKFMAQWNGFIAANADTFVRIDRVADIAKAKAAGKVGIAITTQVSGHFRSPADVDTFFGLGQRLSQLTYNFNNKIGSGFLENRDGGLSVFGLSIMKRMEQVGMAVDVSHCGDQTTLDALAAATKPVVFSHANARALLPGHLRCKTDEAIQKMAKTGGVMGVNFIRFMVRDQEPVTIDHALNHVDYVAKLVGVEHVGMGSDLDVVGNPNPMGGRGFDPRTQPNFSRYQYHEGPGGTITVAGLDHAKRVFDFTEGLVRRGYSDAHIALILGGNAARVFGAIWPS